MNAPLYIQNTLADVLGVGMMNGTEEEDDLVSPAEAGSSVRGCRRSPFRRRVRRLCLQECFRQCGTL